ncbi:MAG: T9SS type A sorting domain-containing protein [Bacteroidia bacterium]|nr:T9SS type A sorting domain-containing protein [Bacteroidia bacterium]
MKQLVFLFLSFLSLETFNAQIIKVYFNQSVDNTVSSIADAQTSTHLDDTICTLINGSNTTLDIAVWDNGSSKIVTALNNAYLRGVQVRYVSSTNSLNTALSGLNSNIPLLKRTSTLTSNVMHNKFIIADNAKLLIGSMNFGNGSIFDDYNNIVIISNTSLAQNYTTEFNEMWGSTGAQPNTTNSKFGPAKSDNTIHSFNIGGSTVESYFSPTDATATKIVNAINSANFSLDVAMFTFTDNDLGDAVVAAKNRGVNVRCIIENVSYFGSEYTKLVNAGIPVISHENITNDFHHKYCIIDAVNTSSDPIVVTGSHNWSNSANDEYDENTLIIHDAIVANQYLEEFSKRHSVLLGISDYIDLNDVISVYPNPSKGSFSIDGLKHTIDKLTVVNSIGQIVEVLDFPNNTIDLDLDKGVYYINIILKGEVMRKKISIE